MDRQIMVVVVYSHTVRVSADLQWGLENGRQPPNNWKITLDGDRHRLESGCVVKTATVRFRILPPENY